MSNSDLGGMWGTLILVLIILITIFLICRELICWYYKINRIVELMEEQNGLLKKMLNGGDNHEGKDINEINEEHQDSDSYVLPAIKSQNTITINNNTEEIHIEFVDGIAGSLFHKKDEYYFKGQNRMNKGLHYYEDLLSCRNALHYYIKTGIILKEGFVGSYS